MKYITLPVVTCIMHAFPLHAFNRTAADWRISSAWNDESCDSVCRSFRQVCIEYCWPTSSDALKLAVNNQLCFEIQSGDASPWHPAKDPVNTMCYWNVDAGDHKYVRCGEKPATPPGEAANGHFIRRLCPCMSASAVPSDISGRPNPSIDCGFDPYPPLRTPTEVRSKSPILSSVKLTTTTSPPRTSTGQQASSDTAVAITTTTSKATGNDLGNATWKSQERDCWELCVNGFAAEESRLNGHYTPVGSVGMLSHWQHLQKNNLILAHTGGRWHFMEGEITLGTSRAPSPHEVETPLDDYYDTATDVAEVNFRCCAEVNSGQGVGGERHDRESGNSNMLPVIISVSLLIVGVGVVVAGTLLFRKTYLRRYGVMTHPTRPGNISKSEQSAEKAGADDTLAFQLDKKPEPPTNLHSPIGTYPSKITPSTQVFTSDRLRSPTNHEKRGDVPNKLKNNSHFSANEDCAAAAVAAVLGRLETPELGPDGVFEGPLNQWWKGAAEVPVQPPKLQVGSAVVLRNMTESSLNGVRGEVEHFNPHANMLHVKLSNGKCLTARPENCQLAGNFANDLQRSTRGIGRAKSMPSPPSRMARAKAIVAAKENAEEFPIDRWEADLKNSGNHFERTVPFGMYTTEPAQPRSESTTFRNAGRRASADHFSATLSPERGCRLNPELPPLRRGQQGPWGSFAN